jgi:hypothetical protein
MALHVFVFVFLLVVCLLFSLTLLWRLDWFHRRPSSLYVKLHSSPLAEGRSSLANLL